MSNRRKTRSSAKTTDPDPLTPPPVTPRTTATTTTTATPLSVLSLKSVSLHDWWLAPASSKGLAVGGFESRGRQGVRVFRSAAIATRHSATILETTDGIRITIIGLINRARSHQNGFPLEICSHFLIGFPYYWEKYATRNHNGDSTDIGESGVYGSNQSGSNTGSFAPGFLSDQPAARIHDAIMFSQGGSSGSHNLIKTIMDDLLDDRSNCSSELSNADSENKGQSETVSPVKHESSTNHEKIKVTNFCRTSPRLGIKIDGQSKIAASGLLSSVGVITRSMSRKKKLSDKNLR